MAKQAAAASAVRYAYLAFRAGLGAISCITLAMKSAGTSGFVRRASLRRRASRMSLSFSLFIFFLFNHP